jgi:hypothetical protein
MGLKPDEAAIAAAMPKAHAVFGARPSMTATTWERVAAMASAA